MNRSDNVPTLGHLKPDDGERLQSTETIAPDAGQKAPTTPSPISGHAGEYKLLKRIGSGGFGEVWRAEAPGGVPAAVKIVFRPLDDQEAQRELQALELIKRLRHPFLLLTQAFYSQEDRLRIVMELADGSLRDRLKECRQAGLSGIPLAELLTYFREAAEALDFLHSEHVIHRDIKPENILILQRHAKVADFGLARLQQNQRSVSASGSGTPAYMAPEIWRGKVSVHSDQYSLAIAYVELRLDRRPFHGADMMELMCSHLERQPDLNPLPQSEQQVILKALDKDPNQRHGSCLEFVQALERALASEQGPITFHLPPAAARDGSADTQQPSGAPTGLETLSRIAPLVRSDPSASSSDGSTETMPPSATRPLDVHPPRAHWPRLVVVAAALVLLAVGGLGFWLWNRSHPQVPTAGSNHPPPVAEVDSVPEHCVKAEGAQVVTVQGKRLYNRLDYVTDDDTRIPLVLIPKLRNEDPETFYMMRDKVSVGLFKKFAARYAGLMKDDNWQKGGLKGGEDLNNNDDRLPALRMCVDDASLFATRWVRGGNLPTLRQWDKAAGRFEPGVGEGPFEGPWSRTEDTDHTQIAVNRGAEGPLPVGTATRDVSRLGIRDLAGNGREWTREVFAPVGSGDREVPLRNPGPFDRVILRGRSYLEPEPLRFTDPRLRPNTPDATDYGKVQPDVGFRVVLEVR